jgi:DNA polymerase III epsilon subunit-like protein
MTIVFKVKSPPIMPKTEEIKDEMVKTALKDINKILQELARDTLDDLKELERTLYLTT